jgi:hypothetical protein
MLSSLENKLALVCNVFLYHQSDEAFVKRGVGRSTGEFPPPPQFLKYLRSLLLRVTVSYRSHPFFFKLIQ